MRSNLGSVDPSMNGVENGIIVHPKFQKTVSFTVVVLTASQNVNSKYK